MDVHVDDWRAVPALVRERYALVLPIAMKCAGAVTPTDTMFVVPTAQPTVFYSGDNVKLAEALAAQPLPESLPPSAIEIKVANWPRPPLLAPVGQFFRALHAPFGGPSPMASTLVGSALGAGLGYGAGRMVEAFLPESHFRRGRLRRMSALLGGIAGAVPGAWAASIQARLPEAPENYVGDVPPADVEKVANEFSASGVLFAPTIPVDAFNNVVWNDVRRAPNPYGTKSPFGDNEQPMATPPQIAAATTGLLAGASAMTNSEHVSPWDVARTAAMTGATGLVGGLLVGKTLGALAGLTPEAQSQLQRAGLWGGLLTGAISKLF